MGPGKPGWQGHRATPGRRQGNGLADGSSSQNSSRPLHAIRGFPRIIQSTTSVLLGARPRLAHVVRCRAAREPDAFLWLLRWFKNEKHCLPAIYEQVTRTASMRQKIEALNAAARYLSPSQKLPRADSRR